MELSLSYSRGRTCPSTYQVKLFMHESKQHTTWQYSPCLVLPSQKSAQLHWQQGRRYLVISHSCKKVASYSKHNIPILEARSIEEIYDDLVERVLSITRAANHFNKNFIIGLAGPPGAGKSTLAAEVVRRLNAISSSRDEVTDSAAGKDAVASVLPMDGFHLYRSQLDAMEGSVYAPSFDHGVGDPVENDIYIGPMHKIVIVEGNYLFLEEGIWKDICAIFDEKWFIDIDLDSSMQRVLKRHIATGKEADVAKWRVDYNDRPNAELIIKSMHKADLIIKSVEFQS